MPALVFIIFCLSLFSCAHSTKTQKKISAKTYYEQAVKYKKAGDLSKSLKTLEELEKHSLYNSYTRSAYLLTADIHFEQKNYDLATQQYLKFQKIYPTTKSQYVRYQLGRSYFYQMPVTPDKDLSKGYLALQNFQLILKTSSSYKKDSVKYIKKINDLKSEKDFQAALFYLKKDWNQSAFNRLQSLIEDYPKSPLIPKALLHSYKLAKKMGQPSDSFKHRLLTNFPKSKSAKSL